MIGQLAQSEADVKFLIDMLHSRSNLDPFGDRYKGT